MISSPQPIHTLYREPFALGTPHIQVYPSGVSIQALMDQASYLPRDFGVKGVVLLEGEHVPRPLWNSVKPKAGKLVTFHVPVEGGGGEGGGGKQVLAIVAAIALTVATGGIAAGSLAPLLGSSFAAGTLGAGLLAAGVGVIGSLALAALTSPPVVKPQEEAASGGVRREPAAVEGNVLERNAPIPRVIGTRRVYPPFGAEPVVELDGQDEYVEAFYVLAGPHDMADFRLGDASIELDPTEDKDVDIQIRNGLPGESDLTLITRQGRTLEVNTQMSVHIVDPENQDTLDGSNPLPVFHAMTTRVAPDENWIQFSLSGLVRQDDDTDSLRIPIRMRMRKKGNTTWRDLPEIHYQNVTQSNMKLQFKIYWGSAFSGTLSAAPASVGFTMARKVVPAQDVAPTGTEFAADDYFSAGAGNDYYDSTNSSTTNVKNIVLFGDRVDIYLDEDEWEPGIYDIEIKRGEVFRNTLFTNSTYDYDGDVLDFFGQIEAGTLPLTRAGLLDVLAITRLVNVWNEYPIQQSGLSLIAVRARNRSVRRLSAVVSGYVLDQQLGRGPYIQMDSGFRSLQSWDQLGLQDDLEVLTLVRPVIATDTSNPESISLMLRGATSGVATEAGYYVRLRDDPNNPGALSGFGLSKLVAGVDSDLSTVRFNWKLNRNYFIRFRADGTRLRAKAWPASIPEPVDWLIDETDSSITAAGWTGFYTDSPLSRNYVNWFAVDVNGGTAQSPPVLGRQFVTDFSEYTLDADLSDWTEQFSSASSSTVYESEKLPYNGEATEWVTSRITSDPAPHFREVLTGTLNLDPLPEELFDSSGVSEWRRRCAESDFKCDLVVEGLEISDLLRVVSSCGYARLYRSENWGVVEDKSRTLDSPVQLFSPRNSANFAWRKAFVRLPTGFRINFRKEDDDYSNDQTIVYRAGSEGSGARLEQVTYDGLVAVDDIVQRARFDLRQVEERSTFYTFNAPVESIVCKRGSLIGLNHDTLRRQYGYARVVDTIIDDGMVTGIVLDSPIEVYNASGVLKTADILLVDQVLDLGLQTGVAIRKTTGDITVHAVLNDTGFSDEIEFETPVRAVRSYGSSFDNAAVYEIDQDCLVTAGLVDNEYKRLIVSSIQALPDFEAQLVCVDEASNIFDDVFGA